MPPSSFRPNHHSYNNIHPAVLFRGRPIVGNGARRKRGLLTPLWCTIIGAMASATSPVFERFRPDDVLGPLNQVEKKNAPEWLYLVGDQRLLRVVPRVSIVGTRDASQHGLKRA